MTSRAVVALGSNLGDREAILTRAIELLEANPEIEVFAMSSFIETVAVTASGPDSSAPAYLNAVGILKTSLDPHALHEVLQEIEHDAGRVRDERWGDRTLDLDVIDFDGRVIDTPGLSVPHPRAHERQFVLDPWWEIDPQAAIPGRGLVAELRKVLR